MYTSWWRCFFQNLLDNPVATVMGLHALGILVGIALVLAEVIR